MFVHVYVSSLQLGGTERDKQMLCMGKSTKSKELSSRKEGLISRGTDFIPCLLIILLRPVRCHAIWSRIIEI